jgi:hypothetical protein
MDKTTKPTAPPRATKEPKAVPVHTPEAPPIINDNNQTGPAEDMPEPTSDTAIDETLE